MTERETLTFTQSVARALSTDYFSIYYVNTDTDEFVEYSASSEYQELGIEESGQDFFNLSRKNVLRVIHPDDQGMFLEAFTKEKVLSALETRPTFTITYRLMIEGNPTYVHLKATKMDSGEGNHIVIGVSSVDEQVKAMQAYERAHATSLNYSRIAQALARDYFSIYVVNPDTEEFSEYSATKEYEKLGIEKGGTDFFALSRKNIERIIYVDDRELFLSVFTKENILRELEESGTFTLRYRLMFGDTPTYVAMKATMLDDEQGRNIIIGVNNIDAQMNRELQYEQALKTVHEKANRDSLTGVKSKHAYVEKEAEINDRIAKGQMSVFSVAVCDVNGLKAINDQQGHAAGDQYIKDACMIICNIFKHSPVFRIGGDEFAVITNGSDETEAEARQEELFALSKAHQRDGGAVIACGMARFIPGTHTSVAELFELADQQMYENKKVLKSGEI